MAIGQSGRLVIEIDPELKRDLYAALEREGLTLREWFLKRAQHYLSDSSQLSLQFADTSELGER